MGEDSAAGLGCHTSSDLLAGDKALCVYVTTQGLCHLRPDCPRDPVLSGRERSEGSGEADRPQAAPRTPHCWLTRSRPRPTGPRAGALTRRLQPFRPRRQARGPGTPRSDGSDPRPGRCSSNRARRPHDRVYLGRNTRSIDSRARAFCHGRLSPGGALGPTRSIVFPGGSIRKRGFLHQ